MTVTRVNKSLATIIAETKYRLSKSGLRHGQPGLSSGLIMDEHDLLALLEAAEAWKASGPGDAPLGTEIISHRDKPFMHEAKICCSHGNRQQEKTYTCDCLRCSCGMTVADEYELCSMCEETCYGSDS